MKEKVGEVVTVNESNRTVRVKYSEHDDYVSGELQIVGTGWVPRVGDQVFCSFTETGDGFIIGPISSAEGD